jgi:hypothetical protein
MAYEDWTHNLIAWMENSLDYLYMLKVWNCIRHFFVVHKFLIFFFCFYYSLINSFSTLFMVETASTYLYLFIVSKTVPFTQILYSNTSYSISWIASKTLSSPREGQHGNRAEVLGPSWVKQQRQWVDFASFLLRFFRHF